MSYETAAQRWLIDRGIWLPGASHAENMRRCFEAIRRWREPSPRPDKQWAHDIMADYQRGVPQPMAAVKLAMAALGKTGPVLRTPSKPVPKPDAKESAAADLPEPTPEGDVVQEAWP